MRSMPSGERRSGRPAERRGRTRPFSSSTSRGTVSPATSCPTGRGDYIPFRELEEWSKPSNGVRHQLFILGSCYSGSVFRSTELVKKPKLRKFKKAARWFARSLQRQARLAITAGLDGERVPDDAPGAGSRFGAAVLRAVDVPLGGAYAHADFNEDGCVSSFELGAYVNDYGGWEGVTHPHFGALPYDKKGVIAFCPRAPEVAEPLKVATGPVRSPDFSPEQRKCPIRDSSTPDPGTVMEKASKLRPAMIRVRGGCFVMGSPPTEEGRFYDEAQTDVEVHGFLMARTEVTQAQWTAVMGSNPSYFQGNLGGGPNHPVEQVSVWDALRYLNALSLEEGLDVCYDLSSCTGDGGLSCEPGTLVPKRSCPGYRLPSEAEWEYGARAGTRTALYIGDIHLVGKSLSGEVSKIAWYGGNSRVEKGNPDCRDWARETSASFCGTQPVARKRGNPWGLLDVLGNVWEWTSGTGQTGKSVVRGCGWRNQALECRVANRSTVRSGTRHGAIGFRPARSVP